ncbi:methylated-DNA--[protein]-cysteine S-methyltransferase [Cupriavidus sp. AU9028]|uniref:methylated-DNA--[protein]-cysteine S-methyltransferase n=1 Tax=Cupriavidus sp. AU9028 TaxID=2871157 RepID=UPI001C95EFC6|nr:methylated-DNA--[protein]-cysteine S-methyltransferase [Cupriavidus sp. AU9028]MBY4896951.1 methylated-DNA--[protein]-cysteine S-methyltransferase [Cupriavidus sp. AU9028]
MTHYRTFSSPLGPMLLRAEADALTGVFFAGQKHHPAGPFALAASGEDGPVRRLLDAAIEQLGQYYAGERRAFDLPVRLAGSAFQQRVWQALQEIPFGETVSYGALARRLDLPAAHARAVGMAVGRNPVSVIVPCHRVLGAAGALTGYAGGIERKQALLGIEGDARWRAGLRCSEWAGSPLAA